MIQESGPVENISHPYQSPTNAMFGQQYLFYCSLEVCIKGQIIPKGLFGILGFFQKTNEQIRF